MQTVCRQLLGTLGHNAGDSLWLKKKKKKDFTSKEEEEGFYKFQAGG